MKKFSLKWNEISLFISGIIKECKSKPQIHTAGDFYVLELTRTRCTVRFVH